MYLFYRSYILTLPKSIMCFHELKEKAIMIPCLQGCQMLKAQGENMHIFEFLFSLIDNVLKHKNMKQIAGC